MSSNVSGNLSFDINDSIYSDRSGKSGKSLKLNPKWAEPREYFDYDAYEKDLKIMDLEKELQISSKLNEFLTNENDALRERVKTLLGAKRLLSDTVDEITEERDFYRRRYNLYREMEDL